MTSHVHLAPDLTGVTPGSVVAVDGDEAHHAVAVRRIGIGEEIMLTDGRGRAVLGHVEGTGKKVFSVTVAEVIEEPEPTPRVTVVQGIPKGDRAEQAVDLLTQVGVAEIVPWAASRSVAVWKGERVEKSHAKWVSTSREAAKVARRLWQPVIAPLATTSDIAALIAGRNAVVLHEEGMKRLRDLPEIGDDIVVIIGPEGGISDDETATFEAAGAMTIRLGNEVLRASTAGVVAVAALLSHTPRWD